MTTYNGKKQTIRGGADGQYGYGGRKPMKSDDRPSVEMRPTVKMRPVISMDKKDK